MNKNYNVYPKNKIAGGLTIFHLPLRHTSFSSEKNRKYDYKSAFPKSKKIQKLIDEINSSNQNTIINPINNNLNNINGITNLCTCQKLLSEERIKNKNYYESIIQLNNHINELESQLNSKNNDYILNNEIYNLKKENEELRQFKQKIYEYSMKYDEFNHDIIICLQNIEKLVEIFNTSDTDNFKGYQNSNMIKISENFESIINKLTNYIKTKEEEFKTILIEKDHDITKLKDELNLRINLNNFPDNILQNSNEYDYEINNNYNKKKYYATNYQSNELGKSYVENNLSYDINNDPNNLRNTYQDV